MIAATGTASAISAVCAFLFGSGAIVSGTLRVVLTIVFASLFIVFIKLTEWCAYAYSCFSYSGSVQLSKKIVDGVAEYILVPDGGICLDVGCGSGALTIAAAKRSPNAHFIGIDRWSGRYSSYSRRLCENKAAADGVTNVEFIVGDACHLDFPDETFDAVTSNYVYHNITGKNKQELLLETLRVLKKGGTFAIHDIMSKERYGGMEAFISKLKSDGYEEVSLIDTTDGKFMTGRDARRLMLKGSAILCGVK